MTRKLHLTRTVFSILLIILHISLLDPKFLYLLAMIKLSAGQQPTVTASSPLITESASPEMATSEIATPEIARPEIATPKIASPEIASSTMNTKTANPTLTPETTRVRPKLITGVPDAITQTHTTTTTQGSTHAPAEYTAEGILIQHRTQTVLEMERQLLRDYDNRIMPPTVGPLHVYMKPLLYALLSIEEAEETLTVYLYMRFHWQDDRLRWNVTKDVNATKAYFPEQSLWKPDILVENMVDMFYPARFQPPMQVQVEHTGNVSWYFPASISTLCQLDLRRFPYDEQVCKLNFISWTLDATSILLHPVANHMIIDAYEEDDEWTLVETSAKSILLTYDCCPNPYSIAAYTLAYRRDPHFYLVYLVLPAYILCILSVIGLFSASTSGPERLERVTLGITSMLTMSVFLTMVAQQIPKISSYVPSIGRFFLSQVGLLAAATVTAVLIMHVERRQLRDGRVPGCLRWILRWPPIPRKKKRPKPASTTNGAPPNVNSTSNSENPEIHISDNDVSNNANNHLSAAATQASANWLNLPTDSETRGPIERPRRRSAIGDILHDLFDTQPSPVASDRKSREEYASEWHFLAGRLDTYAMILYIILVHILTAAFLDFPFY